MLVDAPAQEPQDVVFRRLAGMGFPVFAALRSRYNICLGIEVRVCGVRLVSSEDEGAGDLDVCDRGLPGLSMGNLECCLACLLD